MKRLSLQLPIVILTLLFFYTPAVATNCAIVIQNDMGSSLSKMGSTNVDGIKASLNVDYWGGYISDLGTLYSAPFHWNKSEWETAGVVLGVAAVLHNYDTQIMNGSQDNRTETGNSISSFAKKFGDGMVFLPLTVLYVYGCRTDDNRARKTAILSLESFMESGILVHTFKFACHRSRPFTGDSSATCGEPSFNTTDNQMSFPSGHTASAFSVATIVAEEYRDHPAIPVIAYGIATLTGLSRINDNVHWASDVFCGAALGYYTSKTLLARHPDNVKTWTVLPKMDGKDIGLAVAYYF